MIEHGTDFLNYHYQSSHTRIRQDQLNDKEKNSILSSNFLPERLSKVYYESLYATNIRNKDYRNCRLKCLIPPLSSNLAYILFIDFVYDDLIKELIIIDRKHLLICDENQAIEKTKEINYGKHSDWLGPNQKFIDCNYELIKIRQG